MILTLIGVIFSGITLVIIIVQAINKLRRSRKKKIPNFIKLPESILENMAGLNIKKYTLKNIGGDAFDLQLRASSPMHVSLISQKGTCIFQTNFRTEEELIQFKSKNGVYYSQNIEFPLNSNVIISKPERIKKPK